MISSGEMLWTVPWQRQGQLEEPSGSFPPSLCPWSVLVFAQNLEVTSSVLSEQGQTHVSHPLEASGVVQAGRVAPLSGFWE